MRTEQKQKRVNLSADPFFTAQQSGFCLVGAIGLELTLPLKNVSLARCLNSRKDTT